MYRGLVAMLAARPGCCEVESSTRAPEGFVLMTKRSSKFRIRFCGRAGQRREQLRGGSNDPAPGMLCYTLKLKTRAFGNPTMLRLSLPYSHNLPAARYEEEKERIKGRNVYLLHDAGSQRVCYESLKEIGPLREPQEQDPARRTANHYRRSGYRRCRWSVFLG